MTSGFGELGARAGRQRGNGAQPELAPLVFSVSKLRLMGVVLLCVPFTAAGVFMVSSSTDWATVLFGWLAVLFFGVGGLCMLVVKLRKPTVLTLTGEGIRPESGGFIPWDDFDGAGTGRIPGGRGGTKIIGIRLKSYERFVQSFTPGEVRLIRGANTAARLTAGVLPRIAGSSSRRMRRSLDALRSLPRQEAGSVPLRDVARSLEWSRGLCGWDITFSPMMFRGSSAGVVQDIESYHRRVLGLRSPKSTGHAQDSGKA